MRLPMALFAFGLLFAFWLGALFLHLHGGLTTYSLLLIALTLLVRTRRVTYLQTDDRKRSYVS